MTSENLDCFSKDMKGYIKGVLSDEYCNHQNLLYWVAHRVREPHSTAQELLNTVFDESVHSRLLDSLEDRRALGNHVDLDAWIGMFFEVVLSRGNKHRFITDEPPYKLFGMPSVAPSASPVQCINITQSTEGTFARDRFDPALHSLWFHGTIQKLAQDIQKNGVSVRMVSSRRTDFGVEFYLSPSFIDAKEWAHRKSSSCGKGAVMIFDLPILGGKFQVIDLTCNAKEWRRVVKPLRRDKGVACIERIMERFDYVFGSMSGDDMVPDRPD